MMLIGLTGPTGAGKGTAAAISGNTAFLPLTPIKFITNCF